MLAGNVGFGVAVGASVGVKVGIGVAANVADGGLAGTVAVGKIQVNWRVSLDALRTTPPCPIAFTLRREALPSRVDYVPGFLEQEMLALVEKSVKGDGLKVNKDEGVVNLPTLQGGAEANTFRYARDGATATIELEMMLEPVVYVLGENVEDLRTAVKNEILDDVVYLMWHSVGASSLSLDGIKSFEANLGSFRVYETSPLPRKIFKPPKRGAVTIRG